MAIVNRLLDVFFRTLDAVDTARERVDRVLGRAPKPEPWATEWSPVPPPSNGHAHPATLSETMEFPQSGLDLTLVVEGLEEKLVREALERARGVKAEAARLLGLKPSALYYKLEKYGIEA